jgi:dephospho-CoA kinase
MLRLRKVAVTGGLSCGKSSVCRFFKKFGAYVVSADEIVHQLLSPDTNPGQNVIRLIGSDILINNQISRSKIAEKVFNNPSLLNSLEKILHPAVQEEVAKLYEKAKEQGNYNLFVAEIPLLFESGKEHFYNAVITVVADKQTSRNRFQNATGYDETEFEKRSMRQLPNHEKAAKADYVITNNGSLEDLETETKKLMNILNK